MGYPFVGVGSSEGGGGGRGVSKLVRELLVDLPTSYVKGIIMVVLYLTALVLNGLHSWVSSSYNRIIHTHSSSSLSLFDVLPLKVEMNPITLDKIKTALPVVQVGICIDRRRRSLSLSSEEEEEEEDERVGCCSVCLSWLEREDEMRELPNCKHVFHRECLDKWIDESQVTCPLCRSRLVPVGREDILPVW